MKSKYLGIVSATAAGVLSAALVLGGLASVSSAASGGPTVVLTSTTASSTSSTSIPVTATFSEDVGSFASTSVTATNATVGAVSGSGTTYTFTLTPTAEGAVTVMLPADISSSTASSTGNQQSNTLTFMYDATAPVLAEVTGVGTTTASSSPTYTFSSTEPGTMSLTGTGCMMTGLSTAAVSGNNTITFDSLANGSYHCSLSVADAAGNTSNTLHINFAVDTASTSVPAAPVLSNLMVTNIATGSATITWNTDTAASDQVFYGTSGSYGSMSTLNTTASTTHSVMISGLSEATLYHFQVVSTNAGGSATSSDMTFVTASTASTTPLLVTGVDTVRGNATADGTFVNGWEWILHFVIPDNESNFAMKFGDFINTTNSSSTIPAMNNIHVWTPQSSNASTTASAMTESGNGYSGDMMLTGDTSTTIPGRQVDVHVEVAVPAGTPTGSYTTTYGALSTTTPF
ncbi:MAG TPA: fibronectin type III domain-containing protein [Candidatus Paceibacterota bacterium]|nr:fibronectin type III domain-containing protein [Candidatus Paceibacterota bacterium]